MFCMKCGKQIPDDALFCSGCGAKVEHEAEQTSVPQSEQAVSTMAARQTEPAYQSVGNGTAEERPAAGGQKKKGGMGRMIVAAAVIVVAGVLVYRAVAPSESKRLEKVKNILEETKYWGSPEKEEARHMGMDENNELASISNGTSYQVQYVFGQGKDGLTCEARCYTYDENGSPVSWFYDFDLANVTLEEDGRDHSQVSVQLSNARNEDERYRSELDGYSLEFSYDDKWENITLKDGDLELVPQSERLESDQFTFTENTVYLHLTPDALDAVFDEANNSLHDYLDSFVPEGYSQDQQMDINWTCYYDREKGINYEMVRFPLYTERLQEDPDYWEGVAKEIKTRVEDALNSKKQIITEVLIVSADNTAVYLYSDADGMVKDPDAIWYAGLKGEYWWGDDGVAASDVLVDSFSALM